MGENVGCVRCAGRVQDQRCTLCGAAMEAGGYRVLQVLSELNQSRTYLAQGADGVRVFLKELTFALVPDAKAVSAFTREAELLRQLHHPAIPEYVASFTAGEGAHLRLYLVERFVEGTNLEKELLTRRYSEPELHALAAEILEVLLFLHDRAPPVLHRDLKPANLIRSTSGLVMLVDFGSARDAAASVSEGVTGAGTFGYAPPEQLSGLATASSDVYALGATLAHLISRRPPWELVSAGVGVDVSALHVSSGFRRWLARALEVRPEKRFRTAREALAALEGLKKGGDRRKLVPVAAVLALGVVGGAIAFGVTEARASLARQREASRVHPTGTEELCPLDGILSGAAPPSGTEQFCVLNVAGQLIKNGPSVKWNAADATPIEFAHFKDGALDGPFEKVERGVSLEKGSYTAGKRNGRWTLGDWGSISEGELVDGKKSGVWAQFRRTNGVKGPLASQGAYKADIKDGVWRTYFGDGVQAQQELTYVGGVSSGTETVWFESGVRQSETPKVHGVTEGLVTTWHPNGKIRSTYQYTNGQRNGAGAEFLADGRKASEFFFTDGRQFGAQLQFGPDGKTTSKLTFDGQGREVSRVEYGPTGEVLRDAKLDGNGWQVTEFFPGGAKKAEYRGRFGGQSQPDGPYKSWYATGAVESEGTYGFIGKVGSWRTWWPNGKLKLTEQYVEQTGGRQDGEYREYFESGRLKVSGTWREGRKVGLWVEKDEAGKIIGRTDLPMK